MNHLNDGSFEKEIENPTQYDNHAEQFSKNQREKNQINRKMMYDVIDKDLSGQKVLDLCCGDGIDADHYHKLGAEVIGLDESANLLSIAKKTYPQVSFVKGKAQELPFESNSFDSVFSKYAIMTVADMTPIFNEIHRVLKPGGTMVILCTHPFRQYVEKGATYKNEVEYKNNYFQQRIVKCLILDGTVPLEEPSHTMKEYFTKKILKDFDIQEYDEAFDPAAERINGETYPGFFIMKAIKRYEHTSPEQVSEIGKVDLDAISFIQLFKHKVKKIVTTKS